MVDRSGRRVAVRFDRITERNAELMSNPAYGPELAAIDSPAVTLLVIARFRSGMTTRELDAVTAAVCTQLAARHSDYEWLAARLLVSNLHKGLPRAPVCLRASAEASTVAARAAGRIAARLDLGRDYRLRYFGFRTLAASYLEKAAGEPAESPQHLYMRIALGIFVCQPDGLGHAAPEEVFVARLGDAFLLYDALSLQRVSHATPTMLNAATAVPQMSSCFQVATGDDLPSLFDTLKTLALVSKWSGGASIWLHNVRAENSLIRGTGGRASGLKRYVKLLNDAQLYVDQGGKRPGAFAVYLSVDHDDIFTLLANARPKGEEALQGLNAPDLKYALWVPDLFMEALEAQIANAERVRAGGPDDPAAGDWHLFSPDEAPGLHLACGEAYRRLYAAHVAARRSRRCVKAGDVIAAAFRTWTQAGVPYVLYKDHINLKSNLRHVAPICSSNLCCEITIPSWSDADAAAFAGFHPGNGAGEFGVCNLAAVCLESFILENGGPAGQGVAGLDYAGIAAAAALEVRALNRVIDLNFYPSEECRRSNQRHRPVGVGLMGLADVLARLRLPYGSAEACGVARAVAASLYYGALGESARLAAEEGAHPSFAGSPLSEGLLQPDLWVEAGHLAPGWEAEVERLTGGAVSAAGWADLRRRARGGVRNAYVTAYMPTATTGGIVGQNECFEPFTSNLYTRQTLAGEFLVSNRHLMAELTALGLWDDQMRREVLAAAGSVQAVGRVPPDVRRRYLTARELHPSLTIRTAAAMAPFVCQSMSMNLFLEEPNLPRILRFLFEGWRAGLKTGLYYCHTQPATGAQKGPAPGAALPAASTCAADCLSCAL